MEEVGAESPRKITSEYYRVVDELLSRMLTRIATISAKARRISGDFSTAVFFPAKMSSIEGRFENRVHHFAKL